MRYMGYKKIMHQFLGLENTVPQEKKSLFKPTVLILLILIGINCIILDVAFIKNQIEFPFLLQKMPTVVSVSQPISNMCPSACISTMQQLVASSSPSSLPSINSQPAQSTSVQAAVKDYYVPLGSGTGTQTSWAAMGGI